MSIEKYNYFEKIIAFIKNFVKVYAIIYFVLVDYFQGRRVADMDCKSVRYHMHLYMDENLSQEYLEPFIRHVNHCPDCYEELEINYIMIEGMRRLEEGGAIAVNFQDEFRNRLKHQLSTILLHKRIRIQVVIVTILACLVGILLGSFEQEAHANMLMEQIVSERGEQYFYENTREYMFERTDYQPPSLQSLLHEPK